jgi:translation initiation factor SUI1
VLCSPPPYWQGLTDSPVVACNGTIVVDSEMGEVIQLQGDQRKDVQEFLTDKKEGLELDAKTIKVILAPLPSL